ncbi:MAG: hypothetical protein HUJ27_12300 [Rhodobacteraceae bacterium]|nr:hypothetical protein [Paracoccaceae bacterium]
MPDRPPLTFREAQAVHDLCQSALPFVDEQTAELLNTQAGRFESDADLALFERLYTGEQDPASVAVLLADALQDGIARGTLDVVARSTDGAPPSLRAALVNGWLMLREQHALGYPSPDLRFSPEDRVTRPAEKILPALRAIARELKEPTLTSVAKADYGMDWEEHRSALLEVLFEQDCLFTEDQSWTPSEVVELVAHVRSSPGFVPCTSILLVNALVQGDHVDWFPFRWEGHAPDYRALPPRVRGPILAGIRYLYESDPHFLEHYTRPYDPLETPEWLIPLVEDWEFPGE